jgi:hypothetical protein
MPHLTLIKTNALLRTNKYSILCKISDVFTINLDEFPFVRKELDVDLVSYEISVTLTAVEQCLKYSVNGKKYSFAIPSLNQPLNVLYTSCNNKYQAKVWLEIQRQHSTKPYHLAIGGGDQIYMDAVWELPSLAKWTALSSSAKLTAKISQPMISEITAFYKQKYEKKWFGSPEYADVLPNIPSINMWDDHDIFDGFGSYPSNVQKSDIVQTIYKIARRAFMIYQLHIKPDDANKNLTYSYEINNTMFVSVDTRTERSITQILSPATHTKITTDIAASSAKNVVILLSTAMAFYNLDKISALSSYLPTVETFSVLDYIPKLKELYNVFGLPRYNDDMVDGWCDKVHTDETNEFVERLFAAKAGGKNVTIVVGDVHIGGDAYIERNGIKISQYISSGVGSITTKSFFDNMKLCSGNRTSDGIKYCFDKNTAIFDYNWGRLVVDTDIRFTHHTAPGK